MFFVKFDSGTHFSGMNYPFGDNVIYSDNQPILSWFLKMLDQTGIYNTDHTIGLFNILMLLGIVIASYYISLLLSHYEVAGFANVLFASGIAFMSPQTLRFLGHYGLAYCCAIPMVWYYMVQYLNNKKWLNVYWFCLIVVTVVFTFLHVYYSLLFLLFICGVSICYTFYTRSISIKNVMLIFVAVIQVLVLITFQKLTDPVTDRIQQPYGLSVYVANFESVLLPLQYNIFNLHSLFGIQIKQNYEGLAYIGVTGSSFLLLIVINLLWTKVLRRKGLLSSIEFNPTLSAVVLSSVFILFISFGWPIILNEDLFVSLVPAVSNFRSLGRMAWAFYYAFTIFSAVAIVKLCYKYRMKISSGIYLLIILLCSGFWWMDGIQHLISMRNVAYTGRFTSDFLDKKYLESRLTQSGYKASDFQCLLTLPYFELGGEKFYTESNSDPYTAMKISYNSGLPLISKILARTSVSQSNITIQCMGDSLLPKEIFKILPNKKPVLMAVTNSFLTNGELFLIRHSQKVYTDKYLSLYALYPDSINALKPMQSYIAQSVIQDSFINSTNSDSIRITTPLLTQYTSGSDFTPVTLSSNDKRIMLIDSTFTILNDSIIDLSFWMFIDNIKPAFPYVHIEVFDTTGKVFFREKFIHPKQLGSVYKDWLRIHFSESVPFNTFRLRVHLIDAKQTIISRIVLRESKSHYAESISGELKWFDNFPVW